MTNEVRKKLEQIITLAQECLGEQGKVRASGGAPSAPIHPKPGKNVYSGATGGVRLLISQGYFDSKKDLTTVRKGLGEQGYHYSSQAIHEALKTVSKTGGPLVMIKETNTRLYANRK